VGAVLVSGVQCLRLCLCLCVEPLSTFRTDARPPSTNRPTAQPVLHNLNATRPTHQPTHQLQTERQERAGGLHLLPPQQALRVTGRLCQGGGGAGPGRSRCFVSCSVCVALSWVGSSALDWQTAPKILNQPTPGALKPPQTLRPTNLNPPPHPAGGRQGRHRRQALRAGGLALRGWGGRDQECLRGQAAGGRFRLCWVGWGWIGCLRV
jgi:hypothetical protein